MQGRGRSRKGRDRGEEGAGEGGAGGGRGRGHKDSFTSLPPPPTWRCLQPLPWHWHQDGLHHFGVVQHSCSGPHGERDTQRSAKGLTAWIMQTRQHVGPTHTHVQWGGGGMCAGLVKWKG